jgi:lipid II:glycine glycyltransferase (peptidoglycan interpeptide bridge formation enzyme)
MNLPWNALIAALPDPHILQTWEWGQIKVHNGWTPLYVVWPAGKGGYVLSEEAGGPALSAFQGADGRPPAAAALVLQRSLPLPGLSGRVRMLYAPKGPLLDWGEAELRRRVLVDLPHLARRLGAIFIKIDPEVMLGMGVPGAPEAGESPVGAAVQADLERQGWQFSASQVQFRNTVLLDLTPNEDELLARMKPKTRYNIRLAERKGVRVRQGTADDLGLLYRMYAETSVRDGFVIRGEDYYRAAWTTFLEAGMAEPLIAEVEGEAVAAVVVVRFAGKAYYLYGMSRGAHREKMPNALLQWEAMRRAKAAGCRVYDLWGAPDTFNESDSLWGVYRFKEGLGGFVLRTLGAWDLPVNPLLYRLFTRVVPRMLGVMRTRGKARTQEAVG